MYALLHNNLIDTYIYGHLLNVHAHPGSIQPSPDTSWLHCAVAGRCRSSGCVGRMRPGLDEHSRMQGRRCSCPGRCSPPEYSHTAAASSSSSQQHAGTYEKLYQTKIAKASKVSKQKQSKSTYTVHYICTACRQAKSICRQMIHLPSVHSSVDQKQADFSAQYAGHDMGYI